MEAPLPAVAIEHHGIAGFRLLDVMMRPRAFRQGQEPPSTALDDLPAHAVLREQVLQAPSRTTVWSPTPRGLCDLAVAPNVHPAPSTLLSILTAHSDGGGKVQQLALVPQSEVQLV